MVRTPAARQHIPPRAAISDRESTRPSANEVSRSQFFRDLCAPFYGADWPGAKVSQGLRDSFWLQSMQAGFNAALDCIKAFSETNFPRGLREFDVPTLVLHGDDDKSCRSARRPCCPPR
jgi:pimeloyl-ACP methyl ester carboxylesterase